MTTHTEGEAAERVRLSQAASGAAASLVEVAVFDLGTLRFALRIEDVEELTHAFAFTPLPSAPAVVSGAALLRGQILPVFDLRGRFGLPARSLCASDHFVVARAGTKRVILHVQRALELRSLFVKAISEETNLPSAAELVAGVAKTEDGVLLVYDLSKFLDQAEALQLERALSNVAPEPPAEEPR